MLVCIVNQNDDQLLVKWAEMTRKISTINDASQMTLELMPGEAVLLKLESLAS